MISYQDLEEYFIIFREYCKEVKKFNDRQPNVPSGLTEGLALITLNSVSNKYINATSGDISSIDGDERVEVKASGVGFDRNDCSSFGPKEYFDRLIFVDIDLKESKARVFDCNITYDKICSLQISKTQTFGDQASQGRRPRFSIKSKMKKQMILLEEYTFKVG